MIGIIPFLPYILSGLAVVAGLAGNWWWDITDWQTATLLSVVLVACAFIAQTNSTWARFAIMALIGGALYVKGGIDKEISLEVEHRADIAAIHAGYKKAADAEEARQQKANQEAQKAAAEDKVKYDADVASLRKQLDQLSTLALKDARADLPALSVDAVKRLNARRLRFAPAS